MDLSVIIPTYNERERLTELVHAITSIFRSVGIRGEVIVVDDNSPDGTGEVANQLAQQDDDVKVVHRPGKLGLGSAVMKGFSTAQGDVLGVMDADFGHPPTLLPHMLKAIQKDADFVVASRYIPGGGTRGWSTSRLVLSRLGCRLAQPLTPVRDATSGFFLVKRDVVHNTQLSAVGFKICLELLVRGHAHAVVELPYVFTNRLVGESKMNARETFRYLSQLGSLCLHRRRNRRHGRYPSYRQLPPPA